MLKWKPGAIVAAFVLANFAVGALEPSSVAPWIVESSIAALFAWVYLAYGGGRRLGAIGWVILVSIVFPVAILTAIGIDAYQSWPALWLAFRSNVEAIPFVAPLATALLIIAVRRRHAF